MRVRSSALSKKESVNRSYLRVKSFRVKPLCFADGALFGTLVDFGSQNAELVQMVKIWYVAKTI